MTGPVFHPVATGPAQATVADHESPADVVLWGGWFCPFSHRTWIVLEEKGIQYQYREVNPYLKEETFLKISPQGLTPGLEVHGKPLNDSTIINEFLEDASSTLAPGENVQRLLPADPYERARARLWVDHINKTAVPAWFRLLQAAPSAQAAALGVFTAALAKISEHVVGPFFFGKQLSLVDAAIAPWAVRDFIVRDARGFRREDVPRWKAWAEALERHPSVRKTTSGPDKYVEFNQTFMRNEGHSAAGTAAQAGKAIP